MLKSFGIICLLFSALSFKNLCVSFAHAHWECSVRKLYLAMVTSYATPHNKIRRKHTKLNFVFCFFAFVFTYWYVCTLVDPRKRFTSLLLRLRLLKRTNREERLLVIYDWHSEAEMKNRFIWIRSGNCSSHNFQSIWTHNSFFFLIFMLDARLCRIFHKCASTLLKIACVWLAFV